MTKQIEEFVIGFKKQSVWGWPIATALFLAGTGSGLFIMSMWLENRMGRDFSSGIILGLIAGGIATSAAFIFDLGRKDRFWRVMLRPGKSWLSRGIILIMVMVIFGTLYISPNWFPGLPWSKIDTLGRTLQIVSAVAAFGVMMYSGFLLSYSSAIPFWNTTMLPVLFAFYSFMGGIGSIFALNLALGGVSVESIKLLELIEISLIIATFLSIFIYLLTMIYTTVAAKEAVMMLLQGRLALYFYGGVIVLGLIVPSLIILLTNSSVAGSMATSVALVVAGICELTGGWLFRYCLLKVGVQNKLM